MIYNAEKCTKEAQIMLIVGRANGHLTPIIALGNRWGGVPHPSLSNIQSVLKCL